MEVKDKGSIDWNDLNKYQCVKCLPEELWRTMLGLFDDSFEISNYGRCRRVKYPSKKDTNKVHVLKISDNGNGYKKFAISFEAKLYNKYTHRLVAVYFLDNKSNLPQVNHTREGLGKHDNRSEVLEWCTGRDNILDAHDNGQMDYRTKVKTSIDVKPDEFVSAMYRRYKDTGMVGETAREFDVPRTSLSSIVNKRSRVKITDAIDKEYKNKQEKHHEQN